MDEQHYRNTYSSINPQRCVFEKAINSRVCNCDKSQRFNLADREGVACKSATALARCEELLERLHANARFTLQRLDVDQLGHAQEIKIQNGGLLGLYTNLTNTTQSNVNDIDSVVSAAENNYGSIKDFPYSKIMQVISAYHIRGKRMANNKARPKKEI